MFVTCVLVQFWGLCVSVSVCVCLFVGLQASKTLQSKSRLKRILVLPEQNPAGGFLQARGTSIK